MRHKTASLGFLTICLLFIAVSQSAIPLFAQPAGAVHLSASDENDKKIQEEVLEKVSLLHRSILNRDSLKLDILLDKDVDYVHSNGLTQSKAEMIRSVVSGQHDYRKINPRNIQFRLIGQGAVINMDAEVSLFLEGKPLELDLHIMQIWMKLDNGEWKLVARQSTRNG